MYFKQILKGKNENQVNKTFKQELLGVDLWNINSKDWVWVLVEE